jgi:hypothetical protein
MGIYEGNRSVSQGFFPSRKGIDNVQSDLCSWQLTEGVVAFSLQPADSGDVDGPFRHDVNKSERSDAGLCNDA